MFERFAEWLGAFEPEVCPFPFARCVDEVCTRRFRVEEEAAFVVGDVDAEVVSDDVPFV